MAADETKSKETVELKTGRPASTVTKQLPQECHQGHSKSKVTVPLEHTEDGEHFCL